MKKSNPERLMDKLAPKINGTSVISKRGVPYVTSVKNNKIFNVCYFGKNRIYRIFTPSTVFGMQEKRDFKTEVDVVNFFNK